MQFVCGHVYTWARHAFRADEIDEIVDPAISASDVDLLRSRRVPVLAWGRLFRPQTIVLAIFLSITLIDDILRSVRTSPWIPFQILFEPAFAAMLYDMGFLEDPKQWETLVAKRPSPPPLREDFERLGHLRLVVLTPGTDDASELFVWPEVGGYSSKLKWLGRLEAVTDCPRQSETDNGFGFFQKTDFFIRLGPEGRYDFGLVVGEDWWKKARKSELAKVVLAEEQHDGDGACGTIHLVLGRIPYWKIFGGYYRRDEPRTSVEEQEYREQLSQWGWSIEDDDDRADIRRPGEVLVHKYMRIWHLTI